MSTRPTRHRCRNECPDCGDSVDEERVANQYQEDIPPVRPIVRCFRVHIGRCTGCGRRVQGRHPLQTSDALGAAACQIGPQAVALAVVLNKQFGLSFGKVAALFRDRFGLEATPGGLVRALHRAARRGRPRYEALCTAIRGSPAVSPDETGWRVAALLALGLRDGRDDRLRHPPGTRVRASSVGPGEGLRRRSQPGRMAVYRQFVHAVHQTCLQHLLRRCRELRLDHPHARLPVEVEALLRRGLEVQDRRDAGEISAHGAKVAEGRLSKELLMVLERFSTVPAAERFANHLAKEFVAVFNFLFHEALDAANWRAEQAIRPAVVTRKMCGGRKPDLEGCRNAADPGCDPAHRVPARPRVQRPPRSNAPLAHLDRACRSPGSAAVAGPGNLIPLV